MVKTKKVLRRILRTILGIFIGLILLIVALVLLIRTPWAQDKIVQRAIHYITDQTGTKVELQRLFVTFSGNVYLEGLYLADTHGDSLLYIRSLETGIALKPLLDKEIHVSKLEWDGLRADIHRKQGEADFNFQFLLDAFVRQDSVVVEDATDSAKENAFKFKSIGPVNLSDFLISFDDRLEDMNGKLAFSKLQVKSRKIDLDDLKFEIDKLLLEESSISFYSGKSLLRQSADTESAPGNGMIPIFSIEDVRINNLDLKVNLPADSMDASVDLDELRLGVKRFDLNQQDIALTLVELNNSRIIANLPKGEEELTEKGPVTQSDTIVSIAFPAWTIEVGTIQFDNNYIEYNAGHGGRNSNYFDPDHIKVSNLNLNLENLFLRDDKAGVELSEFNFRAGSSWELKLFSFKLNADKNNFKLEDLLIQTSNSNLNMDLEMTYNSLNDLMRNTGDAELDFLFNPSIISLKDAFYFAPDLERDTILRPFRDKPFEIKGALTGRVRDLELSRILIKWGNQTAITASGNIIGLPEVQNLRFNLPKLTFRSVYRDFSIFLPKDSLAFKVPEQIQLNTSLSGTLDDVNAKGLLKIPEGDLEFDASVNQKAVLSYDAKLKFKEMDLGALLKNDTLGKLSLDIDFKGSGTDAARMNAQISGNLKSMVLGDQQIGNMHFNGDLANQKVNFILNSKQKDLLFDLEATGSLDSVNPFYKVLLELQDVDLSKFAIASESSSLSGVLNANMTGPLDDFEASIQFDNGRVIQNNIKYDVNTVNITGKSSDEGSAFQIESDLLVGDISWNAGITTLTEAVSRLAAPYLNKPVDSIKLTRNVAFIANLTFLENSKFQDLLIPDLKVFKAGELQLQFNSDANELIMDWDIERIEYADIRAYAMMLDMMVSDESANLTITWDSIIHPAVTVYKTQITGDYDTETLNFELDILDKDANQAYFVDIKGSYENDDLTVQIVPDKLILNQENWEIDPDNQLIIRKDRILARNFVMNQGQQKFTIANKSGMQEDHLGIMFESFQVSTLSAMILKEDERIEGEINGEVWAINLLKTPSFVADLAVDNITYKEILIGNLTLDAISKSAGNYAAKLEISGGSADLQLDGSYAIQGKTTALNLDLDLNSVDLRLVENFTNDAIANASGIITGNVKITGSTEKPVYDGSFQFINASMVVNAVNEKFTLTDEQLSVRNQGVYFDRFTILDSRGQSSNISGRIETEKSLMNPDFFLDIEANDFRLLNSTKEDNTLYYGSLLADMDITIRGNLELPIVNARLRLNSGSDLTFVIPESQVALIEREGVVIFVDMQNPENQDSTINDELKSGFGKVQLSAIVEIDSSTQFTIVIDEQSGDNLLIKGEANLSVDVEANGRIGISGEYIIRGGHYEMSLYEIVQRRFDLNPGGRITWAGEPLRANLDLTALYRTKTSSLDLMSTQLIGADQATINRYRQELPFEVLLNIKGNLLQPDISFGLDMPELQRNAIGGNVYNKIQQLNENESELNKQVFSLIVLNRFLPEDLSQSSSGGGGATEIARSSVSKLLSSQLNSLSGKYLKGVDLDFNLDSYTDYQTGEAQNRTQLNVNLRKALLNDRLIVSVGSQLDLEGQDPEGKQNAGDIIGDISLDYLLVPDGRYRLRGFRRNEFEGIIDGQIIVTGLSVAYNRDFDKIRELWKKPVVIRDSIPEKSENSGSKN